MSCPCLISSYERIPPNTTVDTVPARMTHACTCTAVYSLTIGVYASLGARTHVCIA